MSEGGLNRPLDRRCDQSPRAEVPGFGGERRDPMTGAYHLGNGYRAYSPTLTRFTCPDSLSPFGAGGINPYAYCAGDPVNRADPSGHLSWQAWMGIGMGVLGLGMAVFTAGGSIAAAGGVMAALESASAVGLIVGAAGVVGDVTAIASGAAEDVDPKASAFLGWLSLSTATIGLSLRGAKAITASFAAPRRILGQVRLKGLSGRGAMASAKKIAGELINEGLTEGNELSHLERLPPEMHWHIFEFIPGSALENLSLTSSRMAERVHSYFQPQRLERLLQTLHPVERLNMFAEVWAGRQAGAMRRQLSGTKHNFRIHVNAFSPLSAGRYAGNDLVRNPGRYAYYDLWTAEMDSLTVRGNSAFFSIEEERSLYLTGTLSP